MLQAFSTLRKTRRKWPDILWSCSCVGRDFLGNLNLKWVLGLQVYKLLIGCELGCRLSTFRRNSLKLQSLPPNFKEPVAGMTPFCHPFFERCANFLLGWKFLSPSNMFWSVNHRTYLRLLFLIFEFLSPTSYLTSLKKCLFLWDFFTDMGLEWSQDWIYASILV